jgi:hypothetical protein
MCGHQEQIRKGSKGTIYARLGQTVTNGAF